MKDIVKDSSLKTDNKTFTFLHHLNQESPQTWLAIQKIVAPTHLYVLYMGETQNESHKRSSLAPRYLDFPQYTMNFPFFLIRAFNTQKWLSERMSKI
jgi:hypothetical protein